MDLILKAFKDFGSKIQMNENERNERIGRAVVGIGWIIFATKFLIIATAIAGVIVYLMGKPLWTAPIIAVGVYIVYRLIWGLIWKVIEWASMKK